MNFSSVVSYHTNPLTCGVAKFSAELAKRLGVPFVPLLGYDWGDFPLFSLKCSEIPGDTRFLQPARYGLFAHDDCGDLATKADVVFYADPSLGSPGLWCPSLIAPRKKPIRLFSFGMAHKLQTEKYRRVRELLDAAGKRYHLRVSVGLHEGTSLDGAEKHFDALKEIMGPENVTILGILSDDAVGEELANCDYVLAFFEKGLRANNTTVHAAVSAGRPIIANCDDGTSDLVRTLVHDLNRMHAWCCEPYLFSWEYLIHRMEEICANSRSTVA